jgi:hypothetical protein
VAHLPVLCYPFKGNKEGTKMAKASWSYRDRSQETSNVELTIADVSAGGADFDDVMADVAALGAALGTLSNCIQARESFIQAVDVKNPASTSDEYANRESALRVFYGDTTTGEVYHVSIPGPDWENIGMHANTDLADLEDTELAAFVTALEASALSPVGNAIEVIRAVQVGRHN